MGNLCCKRQRNQPYLEFVRYSSENEPASSSSETHLDEIHPSDNNLEQYLNDVYEKECVLKASQEEVEFIHTGIETLVQQMVDEVLNDFSETFNCGFIEKNIEIFNKEECNFEKDKYLERDLIGVYFPIKEGSRFQDLTDIKPEKSTIIKVGSYYEGTRNNFPDEFDFIFLLFCGRDTLHRYSWFVINLTVCSCIRSVTYRKSFHYASPNGTREIYPNLGIGITFHGPACKLQFIYKNGSTEERHIAVDLVPAYKIVTDNNPDWYIDYVNRFVKPKSFQDETMSAESCFVVRECISFTQTEVSFIRNVLSEHHRKVYRILKFLINGHGDDETMRKCLMRQSRRVDYRDLDPYKPYSSYQIKTMMIYHHDECRDSYTTDIGPCVLQVLEEMCKYKYMGRLPAFSASQDKDGSCLIEYIQSEIDTLKSMQTRTVSYSYEEYKLKSVTMQYLEREHIWTGLSMKTESDILS